MKRSLMMFLIALAWGAGQAAAEGAALVRLNSPAAQAEADAFYRGGFYAPVTLANKKGSGGGKTVHVKAYTKKDGTKVAAHDRKAPEKHADANGETKRESATPAVVGVARDDHGRIKRSADAKHAFEVQTGYPHGRPGYVVDHIRPLACGGADAPFNMQWQSAAAAKAKDKWERTGCR